MTNKPCIQITFQAEKDMLLPVRLATSGIAARCGFSIDKMDDIKMAVEEACTCLMDQTPKPESIFLACTKDGAQVSIDAQVCNVADQGASVIEEAELNVIRCVLSALVDQVEVETGNGIIRKIRLQATAGC